MYSDEDRIDDQGRRHTPHSNSDWNPDLFYSVNYVSRLCIYRTELVCDLGGFREGYDGAEEYDLLLGASGQVNEADIRHLPAVLYHRCDGARTDRVESNVDADAWEAGARVLATFFASRSNDVHVERGPVPTSHRARWPLPDPSPLVSIIVPTRDRQDLLRTCLSIVLEKTDYPRVEILVVDNDSRDLVTLAYLKEITADPRIRVFRFPGPFNYSAINNFAVTQAKGEILCLFNDDVEAIESEWLAEMVSHACRKEIGCVGAHLLYTDGSIQHGGVICGLGGFAGHTHRHFKQENIGYW